MRGALLVELVVGQEPQPLALHLAAMPALLEKRVEDRWVTSSYNLESVSWEDGERDELHGGRDRDWFLASDDGRVNDLRPKTNCSGIISALRSGGSSRTR